MRGRGWLTVVMTVALVVGCTLATVGRDVPPAGAATFTPSPDPIVDGAPGSLRATVNSSVSGDVIELVSGATYTLTCAGGGQLFRTGGSYTFRTPSGAPATIRQTCAGERVIEQSGLIIPTNMLTFDNVIVTGGDFVAPLSGGDALGGAVQGLHVTVTSSTFRNNTATADATAGPSARGGAIHAYGEVTVTGSTFTDNAAIVPDGVPRVDFIGGYGGAISAELGATVTDSTFTNNRVTVGTPGLGPDTVRAFGGAIDVNDLFIANEATVTVTRSTFTGNSVHAEDGWAGGGALSGAGTASSPGVVAIDSTFVGNTATATTGQGGFGGALFNQLLIGRVQATNSTIVGNGASTSGGGLWAARATTTYVTMVGNGAPTGANVGVGGTNNLSTFGSVFAIPVGGESCDVGAAPSSSGYNFTDDDSCNLTATGDVEDGGDPMLGGLADNGGPTPTRLPALGSPLLDAIPNASCQTAPLATGITADQRSFARPSPPGGDCDIGAVERQPFDVDPTQGLPGNVPLIVRFAG